MYYILSVKSDLGQIQQKDNFIIETKFDNFIHSGLFTRLWGRKAYGNMASLELVVVIY